MYIEFEEISWKNFLSTGNNWMTMKLNKSANTLIVGENGHGKSQLIDAIFYALFGKPFRKVNKAGLINSRNGKGLEVKIKFKVGSNNYEIHRGMKPNIFNIHCNGKLVNQDASVRDYQQLLQDTVLKMNHQTASQVVILGSATYEPFMQLKTPKRREVIEDILDLGTFTLMNNALKQKSAKLKTDFANNEAEIQRIMQNKALLEQLLQTERKNIDDEIDSRQYTMNDIMHTMIDLSDKVSYSEKRRQELETSISDQDEARDKHNKLRNYSFAFEDKIKKIKDELWFFEENENCPTCLQDIDSDHKTHVTETKEKKKIEFENGVNKLADELNKSANRLEEINEALREMIECGNAISRYKGEIITLQKQVDQIESEIKSLQKKKNQTSNTEQKLNDTIAELEKANKLKEEYLYQANVFGAANLMLKDDGIKAEIIKKYLPVINKAIAKYLQNLGFNHSFELDEEFNETIKSHFIDDFTYENFSQGEKQRIDLALLLAWRHVAKIKGSIKTNLLVMDETFDSSMDQTGVDNLMNLFLSNFGKDINLFVISHRGDSMLEKFDSVLRIEKKKGYSELKEEK